MNNNFRSLDEAFNLPIQNCSDYNELVEGVDYIPDPIKPSNLIGKENSLKIKPKPQILRVESNKHKRTVYEKKKEQNELEKYQSRIDDLIDQLLEEQRIIIRNNIRLIDLKKEELYKEIDILIQELKEEKKNIITTNKKPNPPGYKLFVNLKESIRNKQIEKVKQCNFIF